MNIDIRNLKKWLNEEQEEPIDRQALARVLAMAEQPAQVDGDTIVQTFTGLPRRKLRDLLSGGWEVNGVCFQRIETDGTVRRGAATTGGMVLWWNAEQPAQQRKPLTDEELYKVFPAIATYTEANKTLYRSIARAIEAAHGITKGTK